jgi:hypothetical protein
LNPQQLQQILQVLALMIQKQGYPVDGGHEIFVSDEALATVSPHGQVQALRHGEKAGFCIRYLSNRTIEGAFTERPLEELPNG